jgi:hypothetical protein
LLDLIGTVYQHRRTIEGILHKSGGIDGRIIFNYEVEGSGSLDEV